MTGCSNDGRFLRGAAGAPKLATRVGMTEIDDNVTAVDLFRDVVVEIDARRYLNLGFRSRGCDCLAHSAFRAEQQNAHRRFHATSANASSVLRKRAWFAALISHSGSRHSADIAPRQESAVFTGTGFGSMNRSLKIGNIFRCMASALLVSPARNAWTRLTTSAGNKFDATLTTPTAPTDRNGKVSESSPLRIVKASGRRARSSLSRSTLPPASLIETMFAQSIARRSTVSGPISTAQRPGML